MLKNDEIKEKDIIRKETNLPGKHVFKNAIEIANKYDTPISICRFVRVISNNEEIFVDGKDLIKDGSQYYISARGYQKLLMLLGDKEMWQIFEEMLDIYFNIKA